MNRSIRQQYGRWLLLSLILTVIFLWGGCSPVLQNSRYGPRSGISIAATPWSDADRLFRSDKHWLGGDGAYSVDLGGQRVLWLFGDSFIDPAGTGSRSNAVMVRNSLGIQHGHDPSSASMNFYWGGTSNSPSSFFEGIDSLWYWPGGGVRIGDFLILFFMEIQQADNDLGFQSAGYSAVFIENPDDIPPQWHLTRLDIPENKFLVTIGCASVFIFGEHVYAFGTQERSRNVYLVRWKISDVAEKNLMNMEWWSGSEHMWMDCNELKDGPGPLFAHGQMEFTVHYDPSLKSFVQIQTKSLTDPDLVFRTAPRITGPWSDMTPFFTPPQAEDKRLLIYAAKAHQCLSGADLVLTYAVNSADMDRLEADTDIYYPVFLKASVKPGE